MICGWYYRSFGADSHPGIAFVRTATRKPNPTIHRSPRTTRSNFFDIPALDVFLCTSPTLIRRRGQAVLGILRACVAGMI